MHQERPTKPSRGTDESQLDNPVLASLMGAHRSMVKVHGHAARYPASVSPFMAIADDPTTADWNDLRELAQGDSVVLFNSPPPPSSWVLERELPLLQMTGERAGPPSAEERVEVVPLDDADAPAMLRLAQRTKPGPFLEHTNRLGSYWGVRDGSELVAMAGERLHVSGWTEISAVCTDETHRGRGLGRSLIAQVVAGIRIRGEEPFLHVAAGNTAAIRLYEHLGFEKRRSSRVSTFRPS